MSSSCLYMTAGNQTYNISNGKKIPETVGNHHCSISFSDNEIIIKNINNYTFVNGQPVESKLITREDTIELGVNRVPLDWSVINKYVRPSVSIRHLEYVWNEFDSIRIKQQIADRKFNSLRSATGLITMAAIALSIINGKQNLWYIALYIIAILTMVVFTIKAYRDASKIPQRQQTLTKKFQKEYVCPQCKHFLGNQPYEILAQNDQCPYCKTKFIH